MEAVNVGWLSILPPIIAIGLALITKEVISSLMIGILSGTLIYTYAQGQNLVLDTMKNTFELMGNRFDLNIILFLALVGALVTLLPARRFEGVWRADEPQAEEPQQRHAGHRRPRRADLHR